MSKTAKKSNKTTTVGIVVLTVAAVIWFALRGDYRFAVGVAVGVPLLAYYMTYLKSSLELDKWDIIQIFMGCMLGVYGLAKQGNIAFTTQMTMLMSYWGVLILTAHREKSGNLLEVEVYVVLMVISFVVAFHQIFDFQDPITGVTLIDVTRATETWYVLPIVAPLGYNLLVQPITTLFSSAWQKRKREKRHLLSDIGRDLRTTTQLPKVAVKGTVQAAKTATQQMKAVVPERKSGGLSLPFKREKGSEKKDNGSGSQSGRRPDDRPREMNPVATERKDAQESRNPERR